MGMGPHPDISPFPTNLPKRLEEQGQHDNHAITNGWISGGNDAKELVGCCAGSIESFQWGVRAVTRRQTMRPGRRARIAEPSQLRPEPRLLSSSTRVEAELPGVSSRSPWAVTGQLSVGGASSWFGPSVTSTTRVTRVKLGQVVRLLVGLREYRGTRVTSFTIVTSATSVTSGTIITRVAKREWTRDHRL